MTNTAPYAPGNTASMEAAQNIQHKLRGVRAKVYDYICISGSHGATGSEISKNLDILLYTAKPRCSELKDSKYIYDSGRMRKNDNGSNETVWVACQDVPQGVFKAIKKPAKEINQSLQVFDDVFRRNPHLKSTFTYDEIRIIRKGLGA